MHACQVTSVMSNALWPYGLYIACQAPLSMGFSRQEYQSGLPCSPPRDLPNPGMEPTSLMSPALAGRFFTTTATWEALKQSLAHYKVSMWSERCSVMSDSLWPHGLYRPWNSPGQNTGVGSLSLMQGIFPTQRLNPHHPHCRWILYQLSYQGSPLPKVRLFKTTIWKHPCTPMFIAALFTKAKTRKQHQFSSVTQSCPTLCDPMNYSTPGLPVHH